MKLPSTIEVIGWRAFTNCEKLQSITREGVELSQLKEFHYAENQASSGAFSGCTSLTNFPISKDAPLKEIGANAFYGSGLTSFTAPDALEVIGSAAFGNCANLSRFDFNEGLKCIKLRAFDQCISLQSLHIAGAIESIENYAFNNDVRIDTISITANGGLDLNESPFLGVAASDISIGSLSGNVAVNGVGSGGKATSLKLFCNNVDFGSHLLSTSSTGDSPWHSFDLTGVKTMSSSIESANKCWIWYLGAKAGASWLNKGIVYLGDSDAQASFEAALSGGADNRPHVDAVTNGGAFSDSADFEGGVLATPKKDGYTFSGWYENADFSGDVVSAPAAGKTYYAKWTKKADSDTKPAAGDQGAQGTQDNPVKATYGDTAVNFTVKIAARADSGVSTQATANEEAAPEGKVGFFYNGTKVGEFADYDAATGTATLAYDTTTKVIPAGDVQGLTVKFGGSDTLMPSEGDFYVKIAKADQNLQFAEAQKTQHVGIVSNALTGFESGTGVNYSSSNVDVATVGDDGTVAIIAPGQATITACSLGDDWYNEASATYDLTVTDHDFRAFSGDERGHWQRCAIDGCEATTAISAHQFGAWQVTPASATADGKRVHFCDACGYREEQVIPKADAPLFESPAVSVHISAAADGVDGPQLQNTAEGDAVTYTVSSIDATQPVAIVDLSTGRIHPQIPGRAKVAAAITRGDSQFVATYDLTVTDHEFDEGKVTAPGYLHHARCEDFRL